MGRFLLVPFFWKNHVCAFQTAAPYFAKKPASVGYSLASALHSRLWLATTFLRLCLRARGWFYLLVTFFGMGRFFSLADFFLKCLAKCTLICYDRNCQTKSLYTSIKVLCFFDKNTVLYFNILLEYMILFGDKSGYVFFVHGSAVHFFILEETFYEYQFRTAVKCFFWSKNLQNLP